MVNLPVNSMKSKAAGECAHLSSHEKAPDVCDIRVADVDRLVP